MQLGNGDWARKRLSGPTGTAAALTVALIVGLTTTSRAVGADADELIREGVALRRQRNDSAALEKFQQAFDADHSPRALAQMGLAEHALGRWVPAYDHLNQALGAKNDAWIVKNRATIKVALGQVAEHVGQIEILGATTGAEVRINGVRQGTLPLKGPLTMTTGTVTIDLSAPGFVPVQRLAVVRGGQTSRESFDPLAPASDRASGSSSGSAGAGSETAAVATGKRDVAPLPPAPEGTPSPATSEGSAQPAASASQDPGGGGPSPIRGAAKWVVWGLGAVSTGLGVFGYVEQNRAADDFAKGCAVDAMGNAYPLATATTSLDGCRNLKGDVDSNYRLEVIGFVGAAVFVAAGFALWLTEPIPSEGHSAAVACFPAPVVGGGMEVGCSFRL